MPEEKGVKALGQLEKLVNQESPFDAVMTFSQDAALAASLMVHKLRMDPDKERAHPLL